MYSRENLEEMLCGSEHSLVYRIMSWPLCCVKFFCHRNCCHFLVAGFMAITLNHES